MNGFLGSADLIEDLALLGALDGKLVWGTMNRVGLEGASFEMDDRFNCYDARGIAEAGLDGGKMLLRINYDDPGTASTLSASAEAVNDLAERRLIAMVEPFISARRAGGIVHDLSADAVIRSMAISSALGRTSAYTWLKLPCVDDMERVMEATTLPSLILGGKVPDDPEAALEGWAAALKLPNVRGLVIGRSLLEARGVVVGFGSVAAVRGRSRNMVYAAAKRGLQGFFESLRHRHSGQGLRVQFHRLGFLRSNLTHGMRLPLPAAEPAQVASQVVANLEKASFDRHAPRWWALVAFIITHLPWFVFRRMDA